MLNRLLRTSLLIGLLFGLDKIIGLGRQFLVARAFRLTGALDAFNAANNLPDQLIAILSGGALAFAIIPVLSETLKHSGRAKMWELFARVGNLTFGVAAFFAVILAIFADPLVRNVIVPGFAPDQQLLVINLMRLNLIAALLFSISGLTMSALQAQQHFLLPALAPILYNVGQIVGVLIFEKWLGIYGLALGVILGAALHLGIQIPGLLRFEFRWEPRLALNDEGVRHVLRLAIPRMATIFIIQTIFIANDNFASRLEEGAISAIMYGWFIMQLPETMIGTAAGTALLPTLSELASQRQTDELRRLLRRAIGLILGLTIPITLISLILVDPAVNIVFGRLARFTPEDAARVVLTSRVFLLGLAGHSLVEIAARTFYAHQDARTPLWLAAFTCALFIGLGYTLTPRLGIAGLPLANTVAFTAEAILMLIILYRRRIL